MPASPPRRSTAEALKESEARVRALTREIGSLREDLRREVKRRERAIEQAGQHEATCIAAQRQAQELGYANRKLASELDAALDAARTASERDKRALRTLREGLTQVEQEVAARGKQGSEIAAGVQRTLQGLISLLLQPPGITVLGTSMAQQVSTYASQAYKQLASLQELLLGKPDSSTADGDRLLSPHTSDPSTAGPAAAGGDSNSAAAILHDVEKQQLQDEVMRLRMQLRSVVDKAAGAAGAASLEVQALLRDSQAEAMALRAELTEAQAALQRSAQELSTLQAEVSTLQARVATQAMSEQAATQAMEQLRMVKSTSDTQLSTLQSSNKQLHQAHQQALQDNSALRAEVNSLSRQLQEAQAKLHTLQSSIADNQQELQAAMHLLSNKAPTPRTSTFSSIVPQSRPGPHSFQPPALIALPQMRVGAQSLNSPSQAALPHSPVFARPLGEFDRVGVSTQHASAAAGLRSSWGHVSSAPWATAAGGITATASPPRPYSAGPYSVPSLREGVGFGYTASIHQPILSTVEAPTSISALQQASHPAAFTAAATHLLHSNLDAHAAAGGHGRHSSLTLFPTSSPAIPTSTNVPISYVPRIPTSVVPPGPQLSIQNQGPVQATAYTVGEQGVAAAFSTDAGIYRAVGDGLMCSAGDNSVQGTGSGGGAGAGVPSAGAGVKGNGIKCEKVRKAAGAAAAAAAAAIAARLKAQKAVAAAAAQDSRRSTVDDALGYSTASGPARTLAMERLGARLRVAETNSSFQDDPSTCSSTSRLSSSSGSITSAAAPLGRSHKTPSSNAAYKKAVELREKQSAVAQEGTGKQHNMDKLLQDMHSLDAEIEALEVSMQHMRP